MLKFVLNCRYNEIKYFDWVLTLNAPRDNITKKALKEKKYG